jgi:L-ascorbate metabolism protein UlaG (beta-lactamase superfamily)
MIDRSVLAATLALTLLGAAAAPSAAATKPVSATAAREAYPLSWQAACRTNVPGLIGGPVLPAGTKGVTLRWLGTMNYELDYGGKVYVLDTYYDRVPNDTPIGFTAAQVKRADAIFIGHAHFDHISDAGFVAAQTHAPVYGAELSMQTAISTLGVPAAQTHTLKDGDVLQLPGGVRVDVALAQHSSGEGPESSKAISSIYDNDMPPLTPDQQAQYKTITARGTFSPDVTTKGTLAYGFTFPGGFKVLWLDSAGPVTDGDRALAAKLGPVDVAILAYSGAAIAKVQVPITMELIKLFRPKLYIPGHHDGSWKHSFDQGPQPLFERLRDEMPGTRFIYPLYRSPICVSTNAKAS